MKRSTRLSSTDELLAEYAAENVRDRASYQGYFVSSPEADMSREAMADAGMYPIRECDSTERPIRIDRADAKRFIDALDATDLTAVTRMLAGMVLYPRLPSLMEKVAQQEAEESALIDKLFSRKERPRTMLMVRGHRIVRLTVSADLPKKK